MTSVEIHRSLVQIRLEGRETFLQVGDSFKPVAGPVQTECSSRLTFLCCMHAETACPEDNKMQVRRRNDAITIAVGSTLAVISVVTVFGYVNLHFD